MILIFQLLLPDKKRTAFGCSFGAGEGASLTLGSGARPARLFGFLPRTIPTP